VLKLSRAMRRCPPPPPEEHPFPPAVGRLLDCVAENPNVPSRDLCEFLDVRPSSLSEMLARAEGDGLLTRTADEEDRRIQRINLSEKGAALIAEIKKARSREFEEKTSCFTEEEKAQFCALCNKLSEHLESLASDLPEFPQHHPEPPHGPRPPMMPPEGRIRC
jgi:DNA-binding MarR family transcriptional regulator